MNGMLTNHYRPLFFQVKSFNDALTKEVEHNLNTLYDGTFQTEIGQVRFSVCMRREMIENIPGQGCAL